MTDNRTNEPSHNRITIREFRDGEVSIIHEDQVLGLACTLDELKRAVATYEARGALEAADRPAGTFTEAQVEAAAEAIHNLMQGDPSFKDSGRKREMRIYARAALVAAQGAAPQDPERIMLHHPDGTPKSNDEIRSEAAAKALHETRNPWIGAYGDWGAAGYEIKQAFRESARAALEAAARAAQSAVPQESSRLPDFFAPKPMPNGYIPVPQEPSAVTDINGHSWMSWDESGKNGTYCRSCGGWAGKVGNRQCSPAPVLPSSGVDEDALAVCLPGRRRTMTDDLTTAGVAPQEPNQNETKSGNNFVSLDPEKVAEVLDGVLVGCSARMYITGKALSAALCEAYKEGKLTK